MAAEVWSHHPRLGTGPVLVKIVGRFSGPLQSKTNRPCHTVEFQSIPRIHFSLFNLPSTAFRGRNDAAGDVIPAHTGGGGPITRSYTLYHRNSLRGSIKQSVIKYVAPDASVTFRRHTFPPLISIHLTACHVTRTFSLLQIQIL